jgi:TPR repeat protein
MYYMGEGIKQDYDAARGWFEKAAEKKNPRAEFNLGVMYYRGEGVKQDYPKAKQYFASAGGQGFQEAAFNLGVMNAKGEGGQADIGQAYAWFSLARDLGSERAPEVIKNIERALKPDELALVQKSAATLKSEVQKQATNQ